jgi:hypothetical protein
MGIRIYWLMAWVISPWNPKAKRWVQGRKGWFEELTASLLRVTG